MDLITALVDKSLVVVEPEVLGQARYRLLDSIRAYAAQRLAEAGESAAVQRRLRDYVLAVAERGEAVGMGMIAAPWSAAVEVFRRYDVDVGNLCQVLSRCLATGDVDTGLRICTAVRPCWIARGYFAEGEEWFTRFLALDQSGLPAQVRGAALTGRAQLMLPNDRAQARAWAREGLDLCRAAGDLTWTATALNLLAEADLHAGQLADAEAWAAEALQVARAAGSAWNEGYALGTQATMAAAHGRLREARQLGETALAVMHSIDQQWGVARTLLGLGALARLRGDPDGAIACYQAALPTLREIDSRPDLSRCLAGIGRIALDQGQLAVARQHLAESLRLSRLTGARIGVARGLEAFAALTAAEGQPGLAVTLAAAAAALREAAGLPPARRPGPPVPTSLPDDTLAQWQADGQQLPPDAAVALALGSAPGGAGSLAAGASTPALAGRPPRPDGLLAGAGHTAAGRPGLTQPAEVPGSLTPREREIVALIAAGQSNKGIAEELVISPATAARHVANILAKLGFTSRAQIAAWAAGNGLTLPSAAHGRGTLIQ